MSEIIWFLSPSSRDFKIFVFENILVHWSRNSGRTTTRAGNHRLPRFFFLLLFLNELIFLIRFLHFKCFKYYLVCSYTPLANGEQITINPKNCYPTFINSFHFCQTCRFRILRDVLHKNKWKKNLDTDRWRYFISLDIIKIGGRWRFQNQKTTF